MSLRALVVTNMWPTAADPVFGVFVREQVEALRRMGARCDVAFIDGRSRTSRYVTALPGLRGRIARGGYDLVHAHYVLSGLAVWCAGLGATLPPWLLTHHGVEVFDGWQAPLASWLTRRADRALVQSSAMARQLGLPASDVLPTGVDLELFQPGDRLAARDRLGLPPDRPLIAWIGVDRPEKRLELARRAVSQLGRVRAGAELVVVSGVEHRQVPHWLAAVDAVLVTSLREGGPLVVKEALACDRPVVSTDVGDVGEVLAGLAGCAVVPDMDGEALVGALARSLAAALDAGAVATRAAVEPYDSRRLAARLLAVYEGLARRGRSPSQGGPPPAGRTGGEPDREAGHR